MGDKKMILNDKRVIEHIEKLECNITDMEARLDRKPDKLEKDAYERIADLEVKMAKLWDALLTTTQTGRIKASKLGRRFGGMSMLDNR